MKTVLYLLLILSFGYGKAQLNENYHSLSSSDFTQDWSSSSLITSDDDWSNVPSITGFKGDDLSSTDVQTITGSSTSIDVIESSSTTSSTGGVHEFDGDVVALQGSGGADVPYLMLRMSSVGVTSVRVQYVLKELDTNDAVQEIGLQYRKNNIDPWINIPAGYVADASDGAAKQTAIDVTLPSDAEEVSTLQIRIITADATGADSMIGIDDIDVSGTLSTAPLVGFDNATSSYAETDAPVGIVVPVTLDNFTSQVDLVVSVSGGTAESGDYTLVTTTLSFLSATTHNISLSILDDVDFDDETIELSLVEINTSTGISISPAIHTITITDDESPSIVINEIYADDTSDANGDGQTTSSEDEFIEIVNTGTINIDLTGWVIADRLNDRHVFPAGTILAPSKALVLFSGGSPTGTFGGSLVQVSSTGLLSLNNGDDDVILKFSDGSIIETVTYGSEADSEESITLSPDLTGTFMQHSTVDTDDGSIYSPGTRIDGTSFGTVQSLTWDGSESTNWSNTENWDLGIVPTSIDNVTIPSSSNDPIVSKDAAVNDIDLASGVIVTVTSGASLAIFGNSTGTGELLVKRKSTGSGGYSILGAPVNGANISDLSANYLYDYNPVSSSYVTATGSLGQGKGYFVGYDSSTPEVELSGTPNTGIIDVTVNALGDGLNLVANPYASSISIQSFLNNATNMTSTDGTIYLWDDGGANVGVDRKGD